MKIDYKKELKSLYGPSAREITVVNVPVLNYLMVDGEGDPNQAPAYCQAIEALFAVAYTVKFKIKKGPSQTDYSVMPLEGLWWADDMSCFSAGDKSNWKWTMMIMQPQLITGEMVDEAISEVKLKKNPPALSRMRFTSLDEGRCAQILHIGPFSEEGPTVERLHRFIAELGQSCGKHHEIYLSDIRRAEPAKWKTIIRQPFN